MVRQLSLLVSPVRNSSRALNLAGVILKSNPAAEQEASFLTDEVASLYQKRDAMTITQLFFSSSWTRKGGHP
jgi:hypothetical protein